MDCWRNFLFRHTWQTAIHFISRLNIAKPEAPKTWQEKGGGKVDKETPFHEGGSGEKDGELSKLTAKY